MKPLDKNLIDQQLEAASAAMDLLKKEQSKHEARAILVAIAKAKGGVK